MCFQVTRNILMLHYILAVQKNPCTQILQNGAVQDSGNKAMLHMFNEISGQIWNDDYFVETVG